MGTQTSLMFSGSSVSTQTDQKKECKVEFIISSWCGYILLELRMIYMYIM